MKTDVFPSVYDAPINIKVRDMTEEVKRKHSDRVYDIKRSCAQKPSSTGGLWTNVGAFGGFIACSFVCMNGGNAGECFVTWLIILIIGFVVGIVIDKTIEESYQDELKNMDSRIRDDEKRTEEEIQAIKDHAQIEKNKYLVAFENNAESRSAQFSESKLAKEIIEWMTNGFCKYIEAADRRSHIEKIQVLFDFYVFNNKIECMLGRNDFVLKRWRNLNSPLEQTALARTIAAAIKSNIIVRYPKDVSGTDVSIDIKYSYGNDYVRTTIIYIAPNGDYKEVCDW